MTSQDDFRNRRNLGLFSIAVFLIIIFLASSGLIELGAPIRAKEEARISPTVTPVPATPVPTILPALPTTTPVPSPTATPTLAETTWFRNAFDYRPVAVMIDNHPDARPHSGLTDADVIYEAVVEGGITRFMAVYGNLDGRVVGPVRSARHYFIYWASEYDAIYLHAGSSPQGYNAVRGLRMPRLDYTYGEGNYWRTNDKDAPHNLYTNTGRSRQLVADGARGRLSSLNFKRDEPAPTLSNVVITHPDGYRIGYEYQKKDNSFLRFMERKPHVDAASGVQYHPKNVIVQFVRAWLIPGDDAGRMDMAQVGTGPAYYFVDGKSIEGTWRKDALTSPTLYLDKQGYRMLFNVGQTWIQIVPSQSTVKYE